MKKLTFLSLSLIVIFLIASCSKDKGNDYKQPIADCDIQTITIDGDEYKITQTDGLITKMEITDGTDEVIISNYNSDNLLVSQRLNSSIYGFHIDTFYYDAQNRLVKQESYTTDANGTSKDLDLTTTFEYNSSGQIIKQVDSYSGDSWDKVYESTYSGSKLVSLYSYSYSNNIKEAIDRVESTFEYTNTKNNLLQYYKMPSLIFLGYPYEALDTEFLISKISTKSFANNSDEVESTGVLELQYTFDNQKVTSITEKEGNESETLIKLNYKCN